MTIEAILAVASFIGLFGAWVILPSQLRKRHSSRERDKSPE